MCPVQSVTYVSGRASMKSARTPTDETLLLRTNCFASAPVSVNDEVDGPFLPESVFHRGWYNH